MTELSTPAPTPVAPSNGPPDSSSEDRLSRIEALVEALAAQQAVGPPPEGYSRPAAPGATSTSLATLSTAMRVAQATGHLPGGEKVRRGWMKWPVIREIVLVFRLYMDKRYSPTRAAQLGVPAILLMLVLNWLFFYFAFTLPVVAQILERLVIMVLAVVMYRILAAEVVRYAAVLDYLAKSGRG